MNDLHTACSAFYPQALGGQSTFDQHYNNVLYLYCCTNSVALILCHCHHLYF